MALNPNHFDQDLQNIDLTFIPNRSAEFTRIPPMVELYWDIIENNIKSVWRENKTTRIIPLQDEFCQQYLEKNDDTISNYTETIQEGIKGRVLRTYPSLVRESHFGSLISEIITEYQVSYGLLSETDIDMEQGVDLILLLDDHPFSLSITKESKKTNWEKIKAERKSDISTPHPIKVVVNSENTYSVGKDNNPMWLFKRQKAKEIVDNCLELVDLV